jgi:cell division septation protein DedD
MQTLRSVVLFVALLGLIASACASDQATALYLKARSTVDADSSALLYRRIVAEFPRDSMAAWSLLRLSQYELAYGRQSKADRYLVNLRSHYPRSTAAGQSKLLPPPYSPLGPTAPAVTIAPKKPLNAEDLSDPSGGSSSVVDESSLTPGAQRVRGNVDLPSAELSVTKAPPAPIAVRPMHTTQASAPARTGGTQLQGPFAVQLGAFIVSQNAERLRERAMRVVSTDIVKRERPGATLFVVQAGSFATREAAEDAIPRLAQETGLTGVIVSRGK